MCHVFPHKHKIKAKTIFLYQNYLNNYKHTQTNRITQPVLLRALKNTCISDCNVNGGKSKLPPDITQRCQMLCVFEIHGLSKLIYSDNEAS